MSMLSGLATFGLSALQGYDNAVETRKKETERLQDKAREQSRQDAQDSRAQKESDLQLEKGRFDLDAAQREHTQEQDERARAVKIRDGASTILTAGQDPQAALSALEASYNGLNSGVQLKAVRDANGNIVLNDKGQGTFQRFYNGERLTGDALMNPSEALTNFSALQDPVKYADSLTAAKLARDKTAFETDQSKELYAFQKKTEYPYEMAKLGVQAQQDALKRAQALQDNMALEGYKAQLKAQNEDGYGTSGSGMSDPGVSRRGKAPKTTAVLPIPQQLYTPIQDAAKANGIPADFLAAILRTESSFDPTVTSKAGAQGLGQLIPATQQRFNVTDPFDPVQSINGSAKYLGTLYKRYKGDLSKVAAAYHAGEGKVDGRGFNRIMTSGEFPLTKNYVSTVLGRVKDYTDALSDSTVAARKSAAIGNANSLSKNTLAVTEQLAKELGLAKINDDGSIDDTASAPALVKFNAAMQSTSALLRKMSQANDPAGRTKWLDQAGNTLGAYLASLGLQVRKDAATGVVTQDEISDLRNSILARLMGFDSFTDFATQYGFGGTSPLAAAKTGDNAGAKKAPAKNRYYLTGQTTVSNPALVDTSKIDRAMN